MPWYLPGKLLYELVMSNEKILKVYNIPVVVNLTYYSNLAKLERRKIQEII